MKDKSKVNGGRGGGYQEIGTELSSQLQRNSLKVRQANITTLRLQHWRIIGLKF